MYWWMYFWRTPRVSDPNFENFRRNIKPFFSPNFYHGVVACLWPTFIWIKVVLPFLSMFFFILLRSIVMWSTISSFWEMSIYLICENVYCGQSSIWLLLRPHHFFLLKKQRSIKLNVLTKSHKEAIHFQSI